MTSEMVQEILDELKETMPSETYLVLSNALMELHAAEAAPPPPPPPPDFKAWLETTYFNCDFAIVSESGHSEGSRASRFLRLAVEKRNEDIQMEMTVRMSRSRAVSLEQQLKWLEEQDRRRDEAIAYCDRCSQMCVSEAMLRGWMRCVECGETLCHVCNNGQEEAANTHSLKSCTCNDSIASNPVQVTSRIQ